MNSPRPQSQMHVLGIIVSLVLLATGLSACAPSPTPTVLPTPTMQPTSVAVVSMTPTAVRIAIPPTPTLAPLSLDDRKSIFEKVWADVRDHYVYPDYHRSWEFVHDEFVPRVEAATSPESFYALMHELVDRLGDGVSIYWDPQEVAEDNQFRSSNGGWGGIGASVMNDGRITFLYPGAPAQAAGLKRFEILKAVNGIPYTDTQAFGVGGPIAAIRGPVGTSVNLAVLSLDGKTRSVNIKRGLISASADAYAPELVRLPGTRVGILTIKDFSDGAATSPIRALLEKENASSPLEGLIIDVRLFGTGANINAMKMMLGLFADGGSIGSMAGRTGKQDFQVTRLGLVLPQDTPIVVLTTHYSVGAYEFFAAGAQTLKRAHVVGTPSRGDASISNEYRYSDGSLLLLMTAVYQLPDGTSIQGRGVQPDRIVEPRWDLFGTAQDPQIQAALEELKKR